MYFLLQGLAQCWGGVLQFFVCLFLVSAPRVAYGTIMVRLPPRRSESPTPSTINSSADGSSWDQCPLGETDARGSDESPCQAYHPRGMGIYLVMKHLDLASFLPSRRSRSGEVLMRWDLGYECVIPTVCFYVIAWCTGLLSVL